MMRVAVTGGGGFLGLHVVRALVEAGHQVHIVDMWEPDSRSVPLAVKVTETDVTQLWETWAALVDADAIIHLAAFSDADKMLDYPMEALDVNVMGTASVLNAATMTGARVVFASTDWVYGARSYSPGGCMDTGHLYTTTKIAGEMLCLDYARHYGVPFTVLRLSTLYGPGMRDELVVARFIQQALAGEPLTIHGDRSQKRQFLYVEDAARAFALALKDEAANETYDVVGREAISVGEVARAVCADFGWDSEFHVKYFPQREADYDTPGVSINAALRDLGWEPQVSFKEGLRRTIAWYKEREDAHR